MPDEPNNAPVTGDPAAAPDAQPETPKVFDEKYVKELRAEAAQHRKQARELQTALEQLKAQQDDSASKKMEDDKQWQQLAQKRADEINTLKSQVERMRLDNLRIVIGNELKLPAALINRLQGQDEDELRADAKALAKELGLDKPASTTPEPQSPTAPTNPAPLFVPPKQTTAVAPDGKPAGETEEQRRDRLYGRKPQASPLFKPS